MQDSPPSNRNGKVRAFLFSDNPSKGNLLSWTKLSLKKFSKAIKFSSGVIMDNYLIVLAQGKKSTAQRNVIGKIGQEELTASFLACNLLDESIQEVEIEPSSSLAYQQDSFTLLKYGENQIIKYGNNSTYIITVESFERILSVRCEEEIKEDPEAKFCKRTAQIYKDCLYVYGSIGEVSYGFRQKEPIRNELWSLDLKNCTWKKCETTGADQAPTKIHEIPRSFIFQDNLCIYGIEGKSHQQGIFSSYVTEDCKDLWMLNFNSMEWTKIKQIEKYLEPKSSVDQPKPFGTLYNDHIVILNRHTTSNQNTLCFLNLYDAKNTWRTFDIEGIQGNYAACTATNGGLMTFKNQLLILTSSDFDRNLSVAILDLLSLGISASKSAEEKYLSSLFMNQEKSDVAFKVQEKVIPAHKEILVGKSKYFAGLFNSNMIESKQDVIEVTDCEYEIFKDCLQFIYQGTVNITNENQAIKLYVLADKYLQDILREKCHSFLISIVNMKNLYAILDFARQEDLSQIKTACQKCVQNTKLSVENTIELVKYLENQTDPEFKEENKEYENRVMKSILHNFFEIEKKGKEVWQSCEDFVLKNISMETILGLANFLASSHQLPEENQRQGNNKITKKIFEEKTVRIREETFKFVQENVDTIMTSKTAKSFPVAFLTEYILDSAHKSRKKRMEPSGDNEGNPELKKTKMSDSV